MELKFYRCDICGQIVAIVKKTGVPIFCCGKPMQELVPGQVDASLEKHVPVFVQEGDKVTVTVGSTEHPMLEQHFIEWIAIQTREGNQRKCLKPGDPPRAVFWLNPGDELQAVCEYCNLHGLWKKEI